eukprot:1434055-Amphidinium_carterae.1
MRANAHRAHTAPASVGSAGTFVSPAMHVPAHTAPAQVVEQAMEATHDKHVYTARYSSRDASNRGIPAGDSAAMSACPIP